MKITKAVITLAGKNQRTLPLQTLIDRDGTEKSVLGIIVKEVLEAGIHEIGLVIRPGDEAALTRVASNHAGNLHFIPQVELNGYGHAIYCARDFVGDEPFLHLVGDHIYVSRGEQSFVQHLLDVAEQEMCSISTVQPTREHLLPYYGAIGGQRLPDRVNLYRVETVLEKPTPTEAEQHLMVSGLRAGRYLCFFGMHVLMPSIMAILREQLERAADMRNVTVSSALHILAQREQVLALEKRDWRYDLGVKYGLMTAQLALALSGQDRDYVLTQLLALLAARELGE